MNPKKTTIVLIIIFSISGCIKPFKYTDLAGKIRSQTAHQLKKEKKLIPIGTMGQMIDDIQAMGLIFEYFHLVDLQEARELIVYAVQVFLKNINDNKEVRPYLHNYPFTVQNLEITIWVNQPDGFPPAQGNIQIIDLKNGILSYELVSPSKFERWPILHKETFEEGLKALEEQP